MHGPGPALRLAEVPLCGSFALVADLLRGQRVADLGCRDGAYLSFAAAGAGGCPGSVGLDVDARAVAACRARGLDARQHDLNRLPLPLSDGAFDVVLLSHVLEHVHAPLYLLRECSRILRPGGRLIVGLPVEDGLYSRLRMDYFGGEEGHLYSFSPRNLRKLLGLCGFVEEQTLFHLPRIGNRVSALNALLNRALPGALLHTLSAAYWCVARKDGEPAADAAFSSYFRAGADADADDDSR